jgi:D-glycero-D-manno-heptose 1,7-bisphosphate phosphatase
MEMNPNIMKPAAFLDRDGVLNMDVGYVHQIEQFVWMDGALDAIRHLHLAGYHVLVVTNQSGIGRGLYSEAQFLELTRWTHEQAAAHGGLIAQTYYCPHHPTEGRGSYRITCDCRKPGTGMLKQAERDWQIDHAGSFLIGDKETDLECAEAFGIKGLQFSGGNLAAFVRQCV